MSHTLAHDLEGDKSHFPFLPTASASPPCAHAHRLLVHQLVVCSILSDLVYEKQPLDIERMVHDNRFLRPCIGAFQTSTATERAQREDWRLDMLFARYYNTCSESGDRAGDTSCGDRYECIIAAIKGSDDLRDWLNNTLMKLVECAELSPARVHYGFLQTLKQFVPYRQLARAAMRNPSRRLILTGHSRGAAIATLVALMVLYDPEFSDSVDVYCFTFGCPLIGNHMLQQLVRRREQRDGFTRLYHFMHDRDPVPFAIAGMNMAHYSPCGRLFVIKENVGPADEGALDVPRSTDDEKTGPTNGSSSVAIREITTEEFMDITRRNFNWGGNSGAPTTTEGTACDAMRNQDVHPSKTSMPESRKSAEKENGVALNGKPIEREPGSNNNASGNLNVLFNAFDIIYRGGLNALSYHVMENYMTLLTTYLHDSQLLDESYIQQTANIQSLEKHPVEIVECPKVLKIRCAFVENGCIRAFVFGRNVDTFTISEMLIKVVDSHWDEGDFITLKSEHCNKIQLWTDSNERNVEYQQIEFIFPPIGPQYMLRSGLVRLRFHNLFFSLSAEAILPLNTVTVVLPSGAHDDNSLRSIFQDKAFDSTVLRESNCNKPDLSLEGTASALENTCLDKQIYPPGQVDKLRYMEIRGWKRQDLEVFLKEKMEEESTRFFSQIYLVAVDRSELDDIDQRLFRFHIIQTLQAASCQIWITIVDRNQSPSSEGTSLGDVVKFVNSIGTGTTALQSGHKGTVKFFVMFENSSGRHARGDTELDTMTLLDGIRIHLILPKHIVPRIARYFSKDSTYLHPNYRPDQMVQQITQVVKPLWIQRKRMILIPLLLIVLYYFWSNFYP